MRCTEDRLGKLRPGSFLVRRLADEDWVPHRIAVPSCTFGAPSHGCRRLALSRLKLGEVAGARRSVGNSIIGSVASWVKPAQRVAAPTNLLNFVFIRRSVSYFWSSWPPHSTNCRHFPRYRFGTGIALYLVVRGYALLDFGPWATCNQDVWIQRDRKQRRIQVQPPFQTIFGRGSFWEASDWPLRAEGRFSGRGDGPTALSTSATQSCLYDCCHAMIGFALDEAVVILITSSNGSGRTEGAEQGLFKLKTAVEFVRYIAPSKTRIENQCGEALLKTGDRLRLAP